MVIMQAHINHGLSQAYSQYMTRTNTQSYVNTEGLYLSNNKDTIF